MSSWMQEQRNLQTRLDGSAWRTPAGPPGTTRSGRQYTSSLEMAQLAYNGAETETMFVSNIFAEISSISGEQSQLNTTCPLMEQIIQENCPKRGGGATQSGGDDSRILDTLAWGITGALIAGGTFLSVTVWGIIENYLAGSWLFPRLCTFGEIAVEAVGMGGRGAASCAARNTRYAWVARIISAILLTGTGAGLLKGAPSTIQQNVKILLENLMNTMGGGAGRLLALIGYGNRGNPAATDAEFEDAMTQWLSMQDPVYYTITVEDTPIVQGPKDLVVKTKDNGTWGQWWNGIVVHANQGRSGGKRRRTRHRKNKKMKNKKSKRKMPKRKASKRRKNKRNKTRR